MQGIPRAVRDSVAHHGSPVALCRPSTRLTAPLVVDQSLSALPSPSFDVDLMGALSSDVLTERNVAASALSWSSSDKHPRGDPGESNRMHISCRTIRFKAPVSEHDNSFLQKVLRTSISPHSQRKLRIVEGEVLATDIILLASQGITEVHLS